MANPIIVRRCLAKRVGTHTVSTAWASLRIQRHGTRCAAPLTLFLHAGQTTGVSLVQVKV